jgi:SP family general alpha glucoside:H+ symporter-like MFS transporter
MEKQIAETEFVEDVNLDSVKHFDLAKAKIASDREKSLPVWQAVRSYRKAIFWSFVMSLCIIMEGYDIVLIGAFYAQKAFTERYGAFYGSAGYEISAQKQLIYGNVTTVGNIVGAFANGYLIDKFGFRKVILGCLISVTGLIFIPFFATSFYMILAGEVLFAVSRRIQ